MRTAIHLICLAALLAPGSARGTEPAAPLALVPCEVPGAPAARCASLPVPEDRGEPGGRRIELNLVVLPAREPGAAGDPVVFLHGGPGGAATDLAPLLWGSPWRDRHDIVLVDQRGTGRSAPQDCDAGSLAGMLEELTTFDVKNAARCRRRLEADPAMYTTVAAVEDLEAVRAALGGPRFHLIGGSYGTRVALEYLRRHPEAIRTATLQGVAPPSLSIPETFATDSMRALEHVLDDCAAERRCGEAYPRLRERLDGVVRRLEERPDSARARVDGKTIHVEVTRELFAASLHYALYRAATAARIPYWIDRADRGRYDDLVESTARFVAALAPQLSMGLFLSVTCAEDVPFYDPERVAAASRHTLLRGTFAVTLAGTCRSWPVPPAPAAFKEPVRSPVPVLLISGEADPVTPPRLAEEAARHLEHSVHLVLPEMGHSDLAPGCVTDLIEQFLRTATLEGLPVGCVSSLHRPPFQLPDGRR